MLGDSKCGGSEAGTGVYRDIINQSMDAGDRIRTRGVQFSPVCRLPGPFRAVITLQADVVQMSPETRAHHWPKTLRIH